MERGLIQEIGLEVILRRTFYLRFTMLRLYHAAFDCWFRPHEYEATFGRQWLFGREIPPAARGAAAVAA
ncbi:hypothetical protein M3Y99_00949400 [Aphelenchoides fujianensis]|nr:hypothetical protein M3Y99_00949400 [Aphelenchoides fujianensis]